ncbi:MAG: alpha/beta hydrolase [Ignavibacteria bacterium]|nr:alpha/beta hydrolase [Ignavibacteria bacterium]
MKKFVSFTIVIIFFALTINAYGQENNFPFEVKKTGEGKQSLIFIPGFSCSGEVWNETTSVFEKDYTCYVLTMAGFAGVPPQSDPTFQSWEKGIANFIEQFKIEKPVIIGHSMGGGLAMALAADYPQLISKIVVVDALPCLAALMDISFKSKDTNDCSAIISQFTSATNDEFYQMQMKSVPQMLADTSKQTLVVDWSVKSDRKTLAEMYCDFSNTDLREKTVLIECPALILLESYFVNFKPAINEQFKNLKTANIQYATKGLHFIMYDDTEWYNEQLISFIKQ